MKTYELDENDVETLLKCAKIGSDGRRWLGVDTCNLIKNMFPPEPEIKKINRWAIPPEMNVMSDGYEKLFRDNEMIDKVNQLVDAVNELKKNNK